MPQDEKNKRKTLLLDEETRAQMAELTAALFPYQRRADSVLITQLIKERHARFVRERARKAEGEA